MNHTPRIRFLWAWRLFQPVRRAKNTELPAVMMTSYKSVPLDVWERANGRCAAHRCVSLWRVEYP